MFLLDENITVSTVKQLRRWRIPVRAITGHFAPEGTSDADLIPILHRLAQPTLFTHDWDFWKSSFCHRGYCIVHLAVEDTEAAVYIRRFLNHPRFATAAGRLGKVIQVHPRGVSVYLSRHGKAVKVEW